MYFILRFRVLVLLVFVLGCRTAKIAFSNTNETLPASALKPFGRTVLTANGHLDLVSSASHAGFSFEGDSCTIIASVPSWLSHNYLQYEVDGVYQKRLRVTSKTGEPIVIKATGSGKHTVWVYKATEAQTGAVTIHNISGTNVTALERPKAPLIEFIGNSITCGAAADPSEVPCGTGVYHDQHNAYMAYGPRLARALGTNFILSSVSGIGMYRNWNSEGPAMPEVYEKTDFGDKSGPTWNFSAYQPKVVSIALGTNDFSTGDGKKKRLPFDSARFVNAYIDFIQLVKTKYPAAQVALLSSPMVNGAARTLLQNCLMAINLKLLIKYPDAKPVAIFFFKPIQAMGCSGHPSVEDHAAMAEEAFYFFRAQLF